MNKVSKQQPVLPLYPQDCDELFTGLAAAGELVTFPDVDDKIFTQDFYANLRQEPYEDYQKLTKLTDNMSALHLKQPLTVDDVAWPEIIYPSEVKAKQMPGIGYDRVDHCFDVLSPSQRKIRESERQATYEKALAYFQTKPVKPQHTPEEFFRDRTR